MGTGAGEVKSFKTYAEACAELEDRSSGAAVNSGSSLFSPEVPGLAADRQRVALGYEPITWEKKDVLSVSGHWIVVALDHPFAKFATTLKMPRAALVEWLSGLKIVPATDPCTFKKVDRIDHDD